MSILQQLIPIIPMILLIVLIIVTKRVLESSIISLIVAYLLVSPKDIIANLSTGISETLSGSLYTYLLSVTCIMGIFIRLLQDSGGAIGFGNLLGRYANTHRKSLVATFILGLIIFIDEYLNALVVTSSMRTLTDKHGVPRVMLACTVNSAGVPACIFAPISAWAVYYIALLSDNGIADSMNMTGLQMYVKMMPFMVYPAVFLVIFLLLALGVFPKYGPLKEAYVRAEKTGNLFPESGIVGDGGVVSEKGNIVFFLVPLLSTIVVAFYSGDIFMGVLIGVLIISLMLALSKKMTTTKIIESAIAGVKDMVYILVILLILFTFTALCEDLGFIELVVNGAAQIITAEILPAVMFVVIAALSYVMGSYWATSALCLPIVVELTTQLDANMPLALGALISAAVFPATCAFNCESIIMSSQSAQVQPAEVGLANLPYALTALGVSAVIYLMLGFAM
ncbi:MAG: Na+/H+ antiporter NhaC family protein [Emergencia sp.]|nr:Na+/H+ antiporter NhaC family protein [Emergencia sp.]